MPVSVKIDPFSEKPILNNLVLRVPQARVLSLLQPTYPDDPVWEWPVVTRAKLAFRAGYTGISDSITRVMNGLRAGSSSGTPYPGLLARGMVEEIVLDIEGTKEVNYRATPIGVKAYQTYLSTNGGKLPKNRDPKLCVNDKCPGGCNKVKRFCACQPGTTLQSTSKP